MRNTGTRDADQLRTGTSPVDLVEAEDEARETDRPNASALAVERAAEIMYLLAEWGDGSVSELAEATGSTGSAVHRILTALKRKDLVHQELDSQRYSLSWAVLSLARSLSARADVRTLAYPHMLKLRDISDETITLNVRSGLDRVCIEPKQPTARLKARENFAGVPAVTECAIHRQLAGLGREHF